MTDADKPWISFDDPDGAAVGVLRRWWTVLQTDTGARAALRRVSNPADCAFQPAFHALRRKMLAVGRVNDDALAVVAVLAAGVRAEARGGLPDRLGAPQGDRRVLPELRLQRLLQAEEPDETLRQMRRALAILDNRADIADLARWSYALAVPGLHESTARRFAYAYYGAVAPDPGDQGTTDADADADADAATATTAA
jgi:CRISPR system Cascade subunit CasB